MDRNDELTAAYGRLRLSTAAYAEMIADNDALQTEHEYDEVIRRQIRAQEAWEKYLRLEDP